MRTVLVFGTFDGLHEGHRFLFHEARKLGERLVVIVAPDESVKKLKQREPLEREEDRLRHVQSEKDVDEVRLGDRELGGYHILQTVCPDVIAIGYDQDALREDLERWMKEAHHFFPIISIKKYV